MPERRCTTVLDAAVLHRLAQPCNVLTTEGLQADETPGGSRGGEDLLVNTYHRPTAETGTLTSGRAVRGQLRAVVLG